MSLNSIPMTAGGERGVKREKKKEHREEKGKHC
jgi:hypothetical protein